MDKPAPEAFLSAGRPSLSAFSKNAKEGKHMNEKRTKENSLDAMTEKWMQLERKTLKQADAWTFSDDGHG